MDVLFIFMTCLCVVNGKYTDPEQVHLSYGSEPSQMVVTWVTMNSTSQSTVEFGPRTFSKVAKGVQDVFIDGGKASRVLYIHRVVLGNLTAGQKYVYHCGSEDAWSALFTFVAMETDSSPRFAVYGDLGNENAQSLSRLQELAHRGLIDAVLHVGDFAYDMDSDEAKVGDAFMRQIEAVAAHVPYMTCEGNHENAYNFSNYRQRFTMPANQGIFYSLDIGPIHLISFSTELFFYPEYGTQQIDNQRKWLIQDLKKANKNRRNVPWIVTMGHRPMYCSTTDMDDCTFVNSETRKQLETMFYHYGVDLEIWAHEHIYERLWPIYNYKVCNGTSSPYTNPSAPVHITTGSAGCKERHDIFEPKPDWSAFRNSDYGFTILTALNSSHLHLQQVSDDKGGAIVDDFWIIKQVHGIGSYNCQKNTIHDISNKHKIQQANQNRTNE